MITAMDTSNDFETGNAYLASIALADDWITALSNAKLPAWEMERKSPDKCPGNATSQHIPLSFQWKNSFANSEISGRTQKCLGTVWFFVISHPFCIPAIRDSIASSSRRGLDENRRATGLQ
jgi:hypothetical protein